jgi:hypothetical protein
MPSPDYGGRSHSENYRPRGWFGVGQDEYEEQRRRLGLWSVADYDLHRPRINPLTPPLPGSPGFRDDFEEQRRRQGSIDAVGLGAATFTWTEAIGIFAFGVVGGIVGYKWLEKSGRI